MNYFAKENNGTERLGGDSWNKNGAGAACKERWEGE
jgi:hypothetical protein